MKLYIKNRISLRCKMRIEDELQKLGIQWMIVDLGMVELVEDISLEQRMVLKTNL